MSHLLGGDHETDAVETQHDVEQWDLERGRERVNHGTGLQRGHTHAMDAHRTRSTHIRHDMTRIRDDAMA